MQKDVVLRKSIKGSYKIFEQTLFKKKSNTDLVSRLFKQIRNILKLKYLEYEFIYSMQSVFYNDI